MERWIVWLTEPGVAVAKTFDDRPAADRFAAAMNRLRPGVRAWIDRLAPRIATPAVSSRPTQGTRPMLFYITIYQYRPESGRFERAASLGFHSRAVAEREVARERAHIVASGNADLTVRLTIRTPDGDFVDAPDDERDAHYDDRAALDRLLGEAGA